MAGEFRLDRYLRRIGIGGSVAPDLATLSAIHAAHVDAIPFESFDPLLGRPVKLDLATLQDKLVESRRGGYCFEQNMVLKAALEAVGFTVTGLAGRVRWMAPPDSPLGPRDHMVLKVDLPEGPYLADAGFGACTLDAPLKLQTDVEQRTAMGTYRLGESGGLFSLSAKLPTGWRTKFVFNLEPQLQSDYEMGNWFAATNPSMPFGKILIMERVGGGKRHKLVNRRLSVESPDGADLVERTLASAEEMRQVLDETFNVVPPVPIAEIFARTSAGLGR